ncbi:MAG: GNAT family N-acetyltransferase [Gammaproteobacteria bacterium]
MTIFLETKRLILKSPSAKDLDDQYSLQSNAEVMRYIGQGERTQEEVEASLTRAIKHYEKYHFSLCSVFEKTSGKFVGRAGLIHLAFDETQPDIEVAYALTQESWHKGYATELCRALIAWGFKHLAVEKLVGVIEPKNEASRHVLEKAGMHYVGLSFYKDMEVASYAINKNTLDPEKISFVPATLDDYPTIQNMARFYMNDMCEFLAQEAGWVIPEDGLYECIDFKKYWEKENCFPFLIRYANELAGFVIVDKQGSHPAVDFNIAQFFVLRKFKGKGVGRDSAEYCFNKFRGNWEVRVMPGNEGAYRFWRAVIKRYTQNNFTECTCAIPDVTNELRNVFQFQN